MKNLGFLILAIVLITSCNQKNEKTEGNKAVNTAITIADTIKDGVFIHITESYNDPHRILMPLKMAVMMAKDKDVIVYMDIHAVEILVKGAKDLNFADFESAHTYIAQLTEMKVGVYACPTCLKIAGFKPEDLLNGVQVAQKEKFFNFTKGRIITLDY